MEPPPPRRVPEQRTKRPVDYAWQPLQGLSSADLQYDFGRAEDWKARWDAFRARPDVQARLQTGLQRMERLWSIETGIIEGLYTLNQGTTTTLLEYGFVPNVIRAQDTNIEPERLLLILNDHHTSVGLVHGYIRDERPLSAHTIRELHACITSHQDTHDAVDSLGHRVQRPLRRGVFKHYPNNSTRLDGWVHQYCPPEQVDSELARLLHLYEIYNRQTTSCHPALCAAWLHHRFVQIHPFADGNGRVARALMNWHLIRADFLPVAITHTRRIPYLHALNRADAGDLVPFMEFVLRSLRHMVHQVVGDADESLAILGPEVPPEDNHRDDYPGWRK